MNSSALGIVLSRRENGGNNDTYTSLNETLNVNMPYSWKVIVRRGLRFIVLVLEDLKV